ncbi:hypothetical protein [Micromonospora fluostatini]|uniref:hypothetical protein n=1 Tax=Micromonospora sp. JCM 30529 TaxID=3421643 RepID=UPI003D182F05
MTRSIRASRRAAVLLAGMVAVTSLAAGCGTGQVSETANKVPSVQGVNIQTPDNGFKIRGLQVDYPGTEGYEAGDNAPLSVILYNDTDRAITVTVGTDSAREVLLTGTAGTASPTPSESPGSPPSPGGPGGPTPSGTGSASPEASPSPEGSPSPDGSASPSPSDDESASPGPSAPAGQPARIEVPALSYVQLTGGATGQLQLIGLNEALLAGQQVNLVFDLGNGQTLQTPAPVAVPLTPAAPPSPIIEREFGIEGEGH